MKFRKIFTAVTAAAMCLTISSCGGNENEQVPETNEAGKKIINMTVMGKSIDTDFQLRIAEFNRTREDYEIKVTDRGADVSNVIDKLNLEIISGTTPDIVDGFFLPIESYAEKGLLADYYDFIDNDPEMNREDFLENIFKACEINGGLYENITSFSIHTLIDRKSTADEMQGRTSDDFIDLAERHPDKKLFDIERISSYGLFDCLTRYGWQSFVDKETGKCDFNSERFIRILEFCSTYPDKYDYTMSDPNNEQTEKVLFNIDYNAIYNFYSLRELEHIFGEAPAVIGNPDTEGNGAIIRATGSYIVFENSPVKEGVWEFLRTDYLDEHQKWIVTGDERNSGGGFPVKKSALEFAMEEAKKGYYKAYPDVYSDEYGINTDEDNQKILDVINGAACRLQINENFVYDTIIMEEAETYFSGQKSAKEVAEIIQNRVQNYLDEN